MARKPNTSLISKIYALFILRKELVTKESLIDIGYQVEGLLKILQKEKNDTSKLFANEILEAQKVAFWEPSQRDHLLFTVLEPTQEKMNEAHRRMADIADYCKYDYKSEKSKTYYSNTKNLSLP